MAGTIATAYRDERSVGRDEVHYRARAVDADGQSLPLTIVNISALGMMARCEHDIKEGDWLTVTLPVIGSVAAQVRWSLGGRIGCELERMIELADYYALLAAMLKR